MKTTPLHIGDDTAQLANALAYVVETGIGQADADADRRLMRDCVRLLARHSARVAMHNYYDATARIGIQDQAAAAAKTKRAPAAAKKP